MASFKIKPILADQGLKSMVQITDDIIKAHGYSHTHEWEYECDPTCRPVCLRIWIGQTRRKNNMRKLILTEDEKALTQASIEYTNRHFS